MRSLPARRLNPRVAFGLVLLTLISIPVPAIGQEEGAAGNTVEMTNSEFDPQITMVAVNATVTWANRDSFNHDVTGVGNNLSSPRNMANGATFTHAFTTPGVYDYYCTLHSTGVGQGMWGRVVVANEPLIQFSGAGGVENPEEFGVRWLAHWVGIISFLAVFVVMIIYYFVLKYGETVHATDHRDRKEK